MSFLPVAAFCLFSNTLVQLLGKEKYNELSFYISLQILKIFDYVPR